MMKILLLIIIAICVIVIYDTREIADKYFSSNINNRQIKLMKIISFIIAIISSIIFYTIM